MGPDVWGPNLWGALHTLGLTHSLTPEFLEEFTKVIPCSACASHFKQIIEDSPLEGEPDQFSWTVLVHNKVNSKIGKRIFTVEEARAKWSSRPTPQFGIILLLVLLFFMCCYALKKLTV